MLRSTILATLLFVWASGCGLAPERLTASALDQGSGPPGSWWSFDGDVELGPTAAADPELIAELGTVVARAGLAAAALYVRVTGPALGACLVDQAPCPVPVGGSWADPRLLPGLRWFDEQGRIAGTACLWFSGSPPTDPRAWSDLLAAVSPVEVADWCRNHAGWPLWEGAPAATAVAGETVAEVAKLGELAGTVLSLVPGGGDLAWFAQLCTVGTVRPLLGGSGVGIAAGSAPATAAVGRWRTSVWIPEGESRTQAWAAGRVVVHAQGWRGWLRMYDYDGAYLGSLGDRVTIQAEREMWVLVDGEAPVPTAEVELYFVPEAGCAAGAPELLERWRPCKAEGCRYELRFRWERPRAGRLALRVVDAGGTRLWSGTVSLVGGEGGILERIR